MITDLKIFESTINTDTLIIIDVQPAFSSSFTNEYLEDVFEYCYEFTKIYQIYDTLDLEKDLYKFPYLYKSFSKKYGLDLYNDFEDYFEGETLENFIIFFNNPNKQPTYFVTKRNDYIFWIGGNDKFKEYGHDWFYVKDNLFNFFKSLENVNPMLIGGADKECLYDITTVLDVLNIKYQLNKKLIYGIK